MYFNRVCFTNHIISAITRNKNHRHKHSNEWYDLSSVLNGKLPDIRSRTIPSFSNNLFHPKAVLKSALSFAGVNSIRM